MGCDVIQVAVIDVWCGLTLRAVLCVNRMVCCELCYGTCFTMAGCAAVFACVLPALGIVVHRALLCVGAWRCGLACCVVDVWLNSCKLG